MARKGVRSMSDELKPCPFCGGKGVLSVWGPTASGQMYAAVQCSDCGSRVSGCHEDELTAATIAEETWNTRAFAVPNIRTRPDSPYVSESDRYCGSCGWFALEPGLCWVGVCMAGYDAQIGAYHATNMSRVEDECPWCPGWTQRAAVFDASIEQAAKSMLECLDESMCRSVPADPATVGGFRSQLKMLGVIS